MHLCPLPEIHDTPRGGVDPLGASLYPGHTRPAVLSDDHLLPHQWQSVEPWSYLFVVVGALWRAGNN